MEENYTDIQKWLIKLGMGHLKIDFPNVTESNLFEDAHIAEEFSKVLVSHFGRGYDDEIEQLISLTR